MSRCKCGYHGPSPRFQQLGQEVEKLGQSGERTELQTLLDSFGNLVQQEEEELTESCLEEPKIREVRGHQGIIFAGIGWACRQKKAKPVKTNAFVTRRFTPVVKRWLLRLLQGRRGYRSFAPRAS